MIVDPWIIGSRIYVVLGVRLHRAGSCVPFRARTVRMIVHAQKPNVGTSLVVARMRDVILSVVLGARFL